VRFLEAREPDEVLAQRSDGGHHCHSAMLELCCAELAEALLIALLAETQWIKVPQWLDSADLFCRVEWQWRHGIGSGNGSPDVAVTLSSTRCQQNRGRANQARERKATAVHGSLGTRQRHADRADLRS